MTTSAESRPGQLAEMFYRANIAPWDLGESQPTMRQLAAHGAIRGTVLDPGCGTGWNAVEYARAGCTVTGLDVSPTAIHRARTNARRADVAVDFRQCDVTELQVETQFDTVVDCKLYDNLDASDRPRYAAALHRAMKPGGRLFVFGFGPGNINGVHNHLLETPDYEAILPAAGFTVTYVGESSYQLVNHRYQPMCQECPPHPPGDRVHIPMTEVHAIRGGSS